MNAITLYKQIHPCQCQAIAKLGFKTLINLRLDHECDNQPCNQELAQTAQDCGLNYYHLPIDGDCVLGRQTVQDFAQLFHQSPKPVMVFCGTGNRAKRLYQSAKIEGLIS